MPDMITQNLEQTGADSAAWPDAEKIAYLIILCEFEGSLESKIANAPAPGGRSKASCEELFATLKREHEDDIKKIKNSQAVYFKAFETPAPDVDPEDVVYDDIDVPRIRTAHGYMPVRYIPVQAARGHNIVGADKPPMARRITRWDIDWKPKNVRLENERAAMDVNQQLEGDE